MYLLICDLQVEDEAQVDQDNETKVRFYYCLIPQNPCVNYSFFGLDLRKAIFGGKNVRTIPIKNNALQLHFKMLPFPN